MKMNRRKFLQCATAVSTIVLPSIALAETKKKKYSRHFAIFFKKTNNWYKIGVPTADEVMAESDRVGGGAFLHTSAVVHIPIVVISKADIIVDMEEDAIVMNNLIKAPDLPRQLSKQTMMYLRHMPTTSKKYLAKMENIKL